MKKEAGDYRNELGILYNSIMIVKNLGKEFYKKDRRIKEGDYIFSDIPLLDSLQQRYSFSELKEIMTVTPKAKLKKANSLIDKINLGLMNESEDIPKFYFLMNELCICLDGRELEKNKQRKQLNLFDF